MRRRRGFSLAELVVYCTLLSVMMTSLYLLLRLTLSFLMDSQAVLDLQTSAQKCAVGLTSEIALSDVSALQKSTNPVGIVFLSPRDGAGRLQRDADGNLYWQKWICYYYDSTSSVLLRKERAITATTSIPAAVPAISTFTAQSGGSVMASNLTCMSLDVSGSVASLTATFSSSVHSSNDYQLQITNQAVIHN